MVELIYYHRLRCLVISFLLKTKNAFVQFGCSCHVDHIFIRTKQICMNEEQSALFTSKTPQNAAHTPADLAGCSFNLTGFFFSPMTPR